MMMTLTKAQSMEITGELAQQQLFWHRSALRRHFRRPQRQRQHMDQSFHIIINGFIHCLTLLEQQQQQQHHRLRRRRQQKDRFVCCFSFGSLSVKSAPKWVYLTFWLFEFLNFWNGVQKILIFQKNFNNFVFVLIFSHCLNHCGVTSLYRRTKKINKQNLNYFNWFLLFLLYWRYNAKIL